MTQFIDTTVKQIDGRLRELAREVSSLEQARAALTNGAGRDVRAAGAATRANGRRSTTSAPRARRARASSSSPTSRRNAGRRPRRVVSGGTTGSVLSALASGEAMTATEVATKAGLARPTVSTTLSKLAKSGRVQKAERGYRLPSAA